MTATPIAVFTYNRPQHTRQMLYSLAKCARLDECNVVIFSDGARIPEHLSGVEETREVIHDWAKQNQASVVEKNENWGLARSIVSGVKQLCEEYGRAIVIEDDMILSSRFVDYMVSALDRYQDDDRICQIAGYMFPVSHPPQPNAFFLPLTTTWGWATWQRAWKLYPLDVTDALTALKNQDVRNAFNLDGAYPFSAMLEDSLAERNNSWGIRWWWSMFNARKLVLHPSYSLIWVGGFDGTGTNTGLNGRAQGPSVQDVLSHPWPDDFVFPKEITVNQDAFKRIKKHLRQQIETSPTLLSKIKTLLKKRRFFND